MRYFPTSPLTNVRSFALGRKIRLTLPLLAGLAWGILALSPLRAQASDFVDKGTIYQIYLGKVRNLNELDKYALVKDLGRLNTQSLHPEKSPKNGEYQVFLGQYLGLATLEKVLDELKARNISYEAIESNSAILNSNSKVSITSAILVESYTSLNMTRYVNLDKDKWDLFIMLHQGEYRILTQLHDPVSRSLDFFKFLEALDEKGFESTPISFR